MKPTKYTVKLEDMKKSLKKQKKILMKYNEVNMVILEDCSTRECIDCGVIDGTVRDRLCPYDQVVLNEHTSVMICDKCYDKREEQITVMTIEKE